MPSGGFKLLDTSEVKMAFSGYTMFLGNNTLAQNNYSSSSNGGGGSWISRVTGKDNKPCIALTANEAKQTDRANFNTNHICAVALCTPTQIAPSMATGSSGSTSNNTASSSKNGSTSDNNTSTQQQQTKNEPPPAAFDPELIVAPRTHRMNRDQCALGEVYTLNPPQNTSSSSSSSPCARIRDVETLVLKPPSVVAVGLYNNIATLFAFVDPASHLPKAFSTFQNSISDSEKIIPVQSIRFAVRCTAFTTFTTHVDFGVAHGLAPAVDASSTMATTAKVATTGAGSGSDDILLDGGKDTNINSDEEAARRNPNNKGNNIGPFQPYCELWSVFGFGSGDLIIWSHAQEAMLKRHNNSSSSSTATTKDSDGNTNSSSSKISAVEPGVAVSAIARVDRGLTEQATCSKWSSVASSSSSSSTFNTQVTCFCDLVVGYENGTILVISLNATGGFVNQKLSGWFGFSAIRSIQACPIAPYLLGVGSDDGSLRFMAFPWSFDVESFERELMQIANSPSSSSSNQQNQNQNQQQQYLVQDLNATDIGTNRDPRVLCSVSGAVSGGGITCVAWEAHGEAVVCTGDDDAVSIVSIESTPLLRALRELGDTTTQQNQQQQGSSTSSSNNVTQDNGTTTSRSTSKTALTNSTSLGIIGGSGAGSNRKLSSSSSLQLQTTPFSLKRPIEIRATAIHRRNFHRSWICGSMILSLQVENVNPRTEQPELRTVTAVYTAALDGAVVAGAAFPATQILSSSPAAPPSTTALTLSSPTSRNNPGGLPRSVSGEAVVDHGSAHIGMTRHSSIAPSLAAGGSTRHHNNPGDDDANNNNNNSSNTSRSVGGLAIRHRPLARFLQMARADTVLNFAPVGDYSPDFCPCCCGNQNNNNNKSNNAHQQKALYVPKEQRKRSFVTITAKGTVALWVFYDLAIESEIKQ